MILYCLCILIDYFFLRLVSYRDCICSIFKTNLIGCIHAGNGGAACFVEFLCMLVSDVGSSYIDPIPGRWLKGAVCTESVLFNSDGFRTGRHDSSTAKPVLFDSNILPSSDADPCVVYIVNLHIQL